MVADWWICCMLKLHIPMTEIWWRENACQCDLPQDRIQPEDNQTNKHSENYTSKLFCILHISNPELWTTTVLPNSYALREHCCPDLQHDLHTQLGPSSCLCDCCYLIVYGNACSNSVALCWVTSRLPIEASLWQSLHVVDRHLLPYVVVDNDREATCGQYCVSAIYSASWVCKLSGW